MANPPALDSKYKSKAGAQVKRKNTKVIRVNNLFVREKIYSDFKKINDFLVKNIKTKNKNTPTTVKSKKGIYVVSINPRENQIPRNWCFFFSSKKAKRK
ncbi:MAG: hypothetical protein HQL25_07615 [Candidatus Omnitrophica bacterium]|nr:hypothetical protein [Candidatus Omnitrophota bacterium]